MVDEIQDDTNLCPLTGWATKTLPHDGVCVVVDFLSLEDGAASPVANTIQLAMTRAQADELGQAISRASKALHIPRPSTDSKH